MTLTLEAAAESGLRLAIQRQLDGQPLWRSVGGWIDFDATTFEDAGVAGGETYHYRLRVMDAAGNRSAWSASETVTVLPTRPPREPQPLQVRASILFVSSDVLLLL